MSFNSNVIIDSVSAIMVLAIFFMGRNQEVKNNAEVKMIRYLMICILFVFVADIFAWCFDGNMAPGMKQVLYFFDTAYWIFQAVYAWMWLCFSDLWTNHSVENMHRRASIYAIPMVLEIAIILVNIFTGWVFYINDANVYVRGEYFIFNAIILYLYILAALVTSIKAYFAAGQREEKRKDMALCVYMFLPICGVLIATVSYGASWIWPFAALALFMVYINVQQQQLADEQLLIAQLAEEEARIKEELAKNRIDVMLSQIQPHFIFNALGAIQGLCCENPKLAERATNEFAKYLRGNIDSLKEERPVPFSRELNHIEHYLTLEKMRFAERLIIEYDINVTDFFIPTFTVQPIVENAVHYGITKKVEGGTLKITTREKEDAYIISIIDDGVGFDKGEVSKKPGMHLGIHNVGEKLVCVGGKLEINSTLGVGTTAIITIPK